MTGYLSESSKLRDQIARVGKSIFDRGLTGGSTGNISARLEDGSMIVTPTNASLGALDPETLSLLDSKGNHVSGDAPTKETMLHAAMYQRRSSDGAVVHLHSTHSVAVSIIDGLDPLDVLPPLTAYYVMRVGQLPLVPYFPPGDATLAAAVSELAGRHHAMLLANHGPVVSGTNLEAAQYAVEELEETARLFLLLKDYPIRPLTAEQRADLEARFRK